MNHLLVVLFSCLLVTSTAQPFVVSSDFLCDFCEAVIERLKEKQTLSAESFREELAESCEHVARSSSPYLCHLVSQLRLERLAHDETRLICEQERLCGRAVREVHLSTPSPPPTDEQLRREGVHDLVSLEQWIVRRNPQTNPRSAVVWKVRVIEV